MKDEQLKVEMPMTLMVAETLFMQINDAQSHGMQVIRFSKVPIKSKKEADNAFRLIEQSLLN